IDMGSHAYGGRRTARTETMYAAGGVAYVYLCYGIHALFNVVTGPADEPLAVLIRGIHPTDGIDEILIRRNHVRKNLADGPGKLTRALGITTRHNGTVLTGNTIWLEEHLHAPDEIVNQGPRIGIDYAGEDAKLPYRFWFDYNKLEKSLSEKK
ncbi:MAG: DNA-3-methyladenine glycosylase, partial [Bacteroidota bacterium]